MDQQFVDQPHLKFLVCGASGMIGRALCAALNAAGHNVNRVARDITKTGSADVFFDGTKMHVPPDSDFDCVVNLAGAGIADKRWSDSRKNELWKSRVNYTEKLVQALSELEKKPEVLLSASAIGYYLSNGREISDETSPKGKGFLSDLSYAWEQEAVKAENSGIRTCLLRLGVVLDPGGGALKKMLKPFQFGFGGHLGNGHQLLSWISLQDVVKAILFLARRKDLKGPFNLCAGQPVENREFARCLAKALHRPCFFHPPESLIKLVFGEMAEETMLASLACSGEKLKRSGYEFLITSLDSMTLFHLLTT